jgi:hypothetical protein
MPHFSDTTDVREEAQNILAIDFSDAEILEEQEAAYDVISIQIGEYDATHPKINAIKKAEIKLAACFVLGHFKQYGDQKITKCDEAQRLIDAIKGGLTGAGADISDRFGTTTYQSWGAAKSEDPEQTEVIPYSSLRPGYSYGGGGGVAGKGEPWLKPFYFYDRVITPRC